MSHSNRSELIRARLKGHQSRHGNPAGYAGQEVTATIEGVNLNAIKRIFSAAGSRKSLALPMPIRL